MPPLNLSIGDGKKNFTNLIFLVYICHRMHNYFKYLTFKLFQIWWQKGKLCPCLQYFKTSWTVFLFSLVYAEPMVNVWVNHYTLFHMKNSILKIINTTLYWCCDLHKMHIFYCRLFQIMSETCPDSLIHLDDWNWRFILSYHKYSGHLTHNMWHDMCHVTCGGGWKFP